ncbi:NCKP5 protein, partial [Atractosteus spatula]|nr:NCKP5 protein [Atractosteus spatula]
MEETVRNLLQTQGSLEQTAVDTVDIMKAYKCVFVWSSCVFLSFHSLSKNQLASVTDVSNLSLCVHTVCGKTESLLDRSVVVTEKNSALALENENQREQYERCLDEVSSTLKNSYLTLSDLREECLKLRTRVFDLEQQNRTLNVLFQQRVQPASGLLLQKLHSRIMDLSSGDLLLETERSKGFLQPRIPEIPLHESQQNVKPGISIMKCQSQLSLTVPTQLYPRSSCSSSELSLSSACSEYSSGSCTWNDGKSCSKMSSLTWEKRVSIGSSAPSNISCPAEEQPPTRKKESHILEGLKRLQKRKPMEPSSLKSKWGYKDCMNSNEGIYSPGIKCGGQGALKSQMPCKTTGLCTKREHGKKFTYESDSHDDADDESTNAPSLCQEIPIKDCRTYSKKLTHSVSDSLFSWEYSGKSVTGKPSYFNSKERPEKLTSFINGFLPGEKNCAILSPPVLQCEPSPTERDCALQLSDFDDLEVLEDLHVESGDEKTTAVHQLSEKQAEDTKRLSKEMDKEFTLQCQKYQSKSQQPDSRPKTFNLIKQHKGHSPNTPESHSTQSSQVSPASSSVGIIPQSSEEKLSKTRIPIGLKALVKSPPLLRKSSTVPGKQEKDSINSASKGTMTASHFSECDTSEGIADFEMETAKSDQEIKSETHSNPLSVETLETSVVSENGSPVCAKGDGESRLFKRSVSVTNKTHLKPALGMNGAKARSQSFSTHSGEKPSASILEGPGKIRTQIITNTAERGNSLTRQNSLIDGFQLKPATGQSESPSHSPRGVDISYNRQGSHGSMSSPSKVALRTTPKGDGSKNTSVGDGSKSPPQKEARSLPLADRFGLKNSRRPVKVASHPLFDTVSSPVFSTEQAPEANGSRLFSPNRSELVRPLKKQDPTKGPEITENPVSPSVSTIEEKVMMGIQENMQKGQVQDKPQASETKQKTGSTLASWFGFRKSKLPALSGKKTDASKAKDDKKDIKIGSVLGGKQMKSDKKKDKKKHEPQCKYSQEQTKKAETSDKLGSIMDHCNSQQGQPVKQIQRSATCVGKDQFMKELLNRTVSKGSSQSPALPSVSINSQGNQKKNNEIKGDMEIQSGAVIKPVPQKIHIITDNDEEPTMEPTCQDHVIGSSCQMRTLDSGIGTFPLPDSADRVTGRHLPKSESNPERVLSVSPEPTEHHALATLPKATTLEREVPSNCETCQGDPSSIGQSLSDPTVAASRCVLQRHLSTPTISGVMKPQRPSEKEHITVPAKIPEGHEKHAEKSKNSKEHNNLQTDRVLRVCTYSGSSSGTETESEYELHEPGPDALVGQMKKHNQADQDEHVVKKSVAGNSMSIMDFYQHKVYTHYGEEGHKDVPQYSFEHKESSTDTMAEDNPCETKQVEEKKEGPKMSDFSKISLESLNKINSNSGPFVEKERKTINKADGAKDEHCGTEEASSSCSDKPGVDNLESLSDSLYDSFSSCASQGSNDV